MLVAENDGWFATKLWPIWKKALGLSWPVMTEQSLRMLLRTTDIVVAGFFSPVAVAAVGLADLYARLSIFVGAGLGDGAIALSSQDTGSGAVSNRNETVTQAILLGILAGFPFIVFGVLASEWAIAVLGAESDVVQFGAAYLAIILVSSPARHTNYIAAKAIQGTGDTRTPMFVNGGANVFNIVATVSLAFGLGPLPELSVIGIAVATAVADGITAIVFLGLIYTSWNETGLDLVVPTRWVITKQLVVISTPRFTEGVGDLLVQFPFNGILLVFGTEINAAYHIGQRMYQQVAIPITRGYGTGTSILVGQALGRGELAEAYDNGWAIAVLSVLTVSGIGIAIFTSAEWFVHVFTRDPSTVDSAVNFARVYSVTIPLIALFGVMKGALRGGSETRVPFIARLSGMSIFLLGGSYLFGLRLEYGVVAVYVAIFADYVCRCLVVCTAFYRQTWLNRGARMMQERGSTAVEESIE